MYIYKHWLIGQWAFFRSPSDLFRTGDFFDKNSQITEKNTRYDNRQSPRNKTSMIKNVSISMFYADVSKRNLRWGLIDEALHDHFSATKTFFFFLKPQFFIRRTHVLSSHGLNEKQNEVASKITRKKDTHET